VRGSVCATVDRSSQPTGLGDVRTLTSLNAVLSRKLNSRDTLDLRANGSRTSGTSVLGSSESPTFLGGSVQLSRQFQPRLSAFASVAYSDIYDNGPPRPANLQGRLGIRYRFGAPQ
jgi:hypothetical protein